MFLILCEKYDEYEELIQADFMNVKLCHLVAICKKRGLSIFGTKDVVINRLKSRGINIAKELARNSTYK